MNFVIGLDSLRFAKPSLADRYVAAMFYVKSFAVEGRVAYDALSSEEQEKLNFTPPTISEGWKFFGLTAKRMGHFILISYKKWTALVFDPKEFAPTEESLGNPTDLTISVIKSLLNSLPGGKVWRYSQTHMFLTQPDDQEFQTDTWEDVIISENRKYSSKLFVVFSSTSLQHIDDLANKIPGYSFEAIIRTMDQKPSALKIFKPIYMDDYPNTYYLMEGEPITYTMGNTFLYDPSRSGLDGAPVSAKFKKTVYKIEKVPNHTRSMGVFTRFLAIQGLKLPVFIPPISEQVWDSGIPDETFLNQQFNWLYDISDYLKLQGTSKFCMHVGEIQTGFLQALLGVFSKSTNGIVMVTGIKHGKIDPTSRKTPFLQSIYEYLNEFQGVMRPSQYQKDQLKAWSEENFSVQRRPSFVEKAKKARRESDDVFKDYDFEDDAFFDDVTGGDQF